MLKGSGFGVVSDIILITHLIALVLIPIVEVVKLCVRI